jgi:hypothetical protein
MRTPSFTDLDFVAAPRSARIGRAVLALGLATVAASAAALALGWSEREAEARRVAAASVATAAHAARPPADPALVRAATELTRDLRMPWGRWLADLEAVPSPDIAVLVVEAVPAQNVVRLTADARHAEAMFDYVAQLRRRTRGDVVLSSHQVQPQVAGTPIRFQVQVRWPDAPVATAPVREVTALAPTAAAAPEAVAASHSEEMQP